MGYDPKNDRRLHHLHALTAAHKAGAPWYELAEIYRNGLNVKTDHGGDLRASAYEGVVASDTGLAVDDLFRMTATLERVERYAGGWHPKNLLSEDMEAVEAATRIAWRDAARGREMLLRLKAGNVSKADVLQALAAVDGAAPAKSPHGHWAPFDEGLEMLEFDRLHRMMATGEQIVEFDFDRLKRLARSAGYGQTDSRVHDEGLEAAESDDFMDGEYFGNIDRSERILSDSRPDGANRAIAERICGAMRSAYEGGREQRLAMARVAAATP